MAAILNIACALQIRYYMFYIVSVRGSEFKCVFISVIKTQETFVLSIFSLMAKHVFIFTCCILRC
jgi:hypothetical protein